MKIRFVRPILEELCRRESPASLRPSLDLDLVGLSKGTLSQIQELGSTSGSKGFSKQLRGIEKSLVSDLVTTDSRLNGYSRPPTVESLLSVNQLSTKVGDGATRLLSNSDSNAEFSILARSLENTFSASASRLPVPSRIDLAMKTGAQWLNEQDEQGGGKPGWYVPVNWSDDDDDGWSPASIKPPSTVAPTANSGPVYSPDMNDNLVTGGDKDLFEFRVTMSLTPTSIFVPPDGNVKITFDSTKLRVWWTNDKSGGQLSSGDLINYYDNDMQTLGYKKLFAEGISGSTTFKDSFIKAEAVNLTNCVPASPAIDNVEVTTFEITNNGKFGPGGKSQDNEYSFIGQNASNNTLGKINYSDPNESVCHYFTNCMEMQGTVTPPVVVGQYYPYAYQQIPQLGDNKIVTFDATRYAFGCEWGLRSTDNVWVAGAGGGYLQYQWHNDTTGGKDVTISDSSHIYLSDGPGYYDTNLSTPYKEWQQSLDFINCFSAVIYGTSYQVSNYAEWHSQIILVTNPADTTKLIRGDSFDQLLGNNWIDIPLNP